MEKLITFFCYLPNIAFGIFIWLINPVNLMNLRLFLVCTASISAIIILLKMRKNQKIINEHKSLERDVELIQAYMLGVQHGRNELDNLFKDSIELVKTRELVIADAVDSVIALLDMHGYPLIHSKTGASGQGMQSDYWKMTIDTLNDVSKNLRPEDYQEVEIPNLQNLQIGDV